MQTMNTNSTGNVPLDVPDQHLGSNPPSTSGRKRLRETSDGSGQEVQDLEVQSYMQQACEPILEQIESCLNTGIVEGASVAETKSLFVALPELHGECQKKLASVKRVISETLDEPIETLVGVVGAPGKFHESKQR